MSTLPALLAALEPVDGGWRAAIPESWMQGRTSYGGLSAALALTAAHRSDADLPPLRSAQVAFIGPLAGAVRVSAQRLRRGRNAAWVQADVASDAGLGLRATFVFMREQESRIAWRQGTPPDVTAPGPDTVSVPGPRSVPFTQQFEFVDAPAAGPAEWLRWTRLRDRTGLHSEVELLAVADCLPPAAFKLAGGRVPISSMTWQVDLLGAAPSADGWYLLSAATDHALDGVSSQRMAVWNAALEPAAQQMQSVALFG